MNEAILYLLPTPLSDENILSQTVPQNISVVNECDYFIVENLKTARRYLRAVNKQFNIDARNFVELNEHTKDVEIVEIFRFMHKEKKKTILMSEAGCPGVADPGATIVRLAHDSNIKVVPLIGPSSIILAIMASGLNGQNFWFDGYLPKEKNERVQKIKSLEKMSLHRSQWFIETPYNNMRLFGELVNTLNKGTRLCIAANINSSSEFIKTKTVFDWKNQTAPQLHKIPTVFGIGQ